MRVIKDGLISVLFAFLFLVAAFAFDDSYEDSKLSAQVLDEAIAQANEEQQLFTPEFIEFQSDLNTVTMREGRRE